MLSHNELNTSHPLGVSWCCMVLLIVWVMRISFMQSYRLSPCRLESRLVFMFFRCMHGPNMVSMAMLARCIVWYVTGSSFQVFKISSSLSRSDSFFVYLCSLTSTAHWHASLSKSFFLLSLVSDAFRSATSTWNSPKERWMGDELKIVCTWNDPKHDLKDIRRADVKPAGRAQNVEWDHLLSLDWSQCLWLRVLAYFLLCRNSK